MPKRRLYDPIIVQEEPKHTQRQTASAKNTLSPGEKSASSSRSRTASRKTRRNATNSINSRASVSRKNYTASHAAAPSNNVPSNNRRSTQILVKLSEACQSHQNDTHPNTTHDDGNNSSNNDISNNVKNARDHLGKEDSNIPAACQSAISKLEPLLPRLQREIAPIWAQQKDEQTQWAAVTPTSKHAATLEDVLLLCDFYNSALSGYYCPHLLRLFHRGHNFSNSESIV